MLCRGLVESSHASGSATVQYQLFALQAEAHDDRDCGVHHQPLHLRWHIRTWSVARDHGQGLFGLKDRVLSKDLAAAQKGRNVWVLHKGGPQAPQKRGIRRAKKRHSMAQLLGYSAQTRVRTRVVGGANQ